MSAMLRRVVVVCVVISLAAAFSAVVSAQPAGGGYGPCCPMVKGQKPLATCGACVAGPRYTCQTHPVQLSFNGTPHPVEALEAAGSLLVPARVFTMLGADLEWGGNRHLVVSLKPSRVELTLGSHAVTINNGTDTQVVSWPLCPRLINNITYVPLRGLAEALGLKVAAAAGVINVTSGEASAAGVDTKPAAGSCPADRVEAALGVTVVRSPAECAFGTGAGITEVKAGGLGAGFGLQAKDVIIGANDKPVKCPKDLDQILLQVAAQPGDLKTLVVARGQDKVTLQAKPAQ